MTSAKQIDANRQNAKSSTGPQNTAITRYNALSHGILSQQTLISEGEGIEDRELFNQLSEALQEDWNPVGATEQLLVEKLIMLTWRRRRLLRYETGSIRDVADYVLEDWETEKSTPKFLSEALGGIWTKPSWTFTHQLMQYNLALEQALARFEGINPKAGNPELYRWIFTVCEKLFKINVQEILDIEKAWTEYEHWASSETNRVIKVTCQSHNITRKEFWGAVRKRIQEEIEEIQKQMARRSLEIQQQRLLASLPDETQLAKIQGYEAHISREFYKALHELQRLQANRLSGVPVTPMAVDVEINGPQ